jgi:hypothetical protein
MPSKRANFEIWQATNSFIAAAETLFECDAVEFYAPKNQWLRDLWLACKFARGVSARKVRLIPASMLRPDFQVQLRNGSIMTIEATEVDRPGRRRHDEYRRSRAEGYPLRADPVEDWQGRRLAIPGAVRRAAEAKAAKSYPSGTSLLIYVNLGTYGTWRSELMHEIVANSEPAKHAFFSVWALWSGELFRCWPCLLTSGPSNATPTH